MNKKWKTLLALCSATAAISGGAALAESFPSQSVTIVVPWPPGGPSDIGARPLAAYLHKELGEPVVIDNRAGAGGNIGSNIVAKAKPDGHTLLFSSSGPFVINPYIYTKMPYNAETDFTPVSNLLKVPLVLVVNPSVPANNPQELLAYIKEQKGNFQWASAGNGSTQHLTGELFQMTAELDMIHIPYNGTAPAITDLMGEHVPMMFDSTIAIVPHIQSGKVRPIAITSPERSTLLPDVPTFAEAGLPGVEASAWYGLFAPANTPTEVVNKLNKATRDFMKTDEYKRIRDDTGSVPVDESPEEFATFVKEEAIKWKDLVEATNTTLD